MALPWLIALQSIPWGHVIETAPKIAEGASKLWDAVARTKVGTPEGGTGSKNGMGQSGADLVAALELRLADCESSAEQHREQLVSALKITAELAQQNAQLVEQVDVVRRLAYWSLGTAMVSGVVGASVLALHFARHAG